ncbi:dihydrolipoyl dehydrogenase family protein [Halogeometricum luteum]|uniref:Dihydrolipoyl dehydrogenase n=1 Tax=Halogeometricum luteum TaxID=2950537 RepID=A0ABU2G3Y7_9EURY|nr:dihydrolipoyl dehydrogenase [Halogeometricum sp. S3BR5-2]MDS0295191.1 dihydrolipoyl dehydrogenase [Halogeometricum sp. S3BR5-2]
MREYDLIVLGGGTGNIVAAAAADGGLDVALVERDRLGGTCLNRGCNPSKKLIHRADAAETITNADSLGLDASLDGVAFGDIVDEVIGEVTAEAEEKAERAREHERIDFYQTEGRFVGERTVEVDAEGESGEGDSTAELTAERIVLAGGSRPVVPDSIDGTDEADFLTSDEALRLRELPDRLVVAGGGYIAVEMAHLFGALGTDVAVVGRGNVLLGREDREVAERLTEAYEEKHELHLGREVTELREDGEETVVVAESEEGENGDGDGNGENGDGRIELAGDEVLLATGRRPNTDRWNVSAAGLDTDEDGFVETDEYLETSVDGVYAIGDIAGNYMFKHSGDKEAEHVVESLLGESRSAVSYPGMAHAVFGSPQVGSLGKTEEEIDGGYEAGRYDYDDTALGSVLPGDGFAKALVADDGEVLGFHVVGPHASMLVHEVSTAVAAGADAKTVAETIHVHPALSEVVQGAFREVRDVAPSGI